MAVSQNKKIGFAKKTRETETSKYPKEKKSTEIPLVVASESGNKKILVGEAHKLCNSRFIEYVEKYSQRR
jgi:hypothetical protein